MFSEVVDFAYAIVDLIVILQNLYKVMSYWKKIYQNLKPLGWFYCF
jgi:hypothetical protein